MCLNLIKEALGKPYFEGGGCVIYNLDCLPSMRALPPETIDLTITSPPYNIGKEYEQLMQIEEYVGWCRAWIEQTYRLTKPAGAFWLNLGYTRLPGKAKALPLPYLIWKESPFYLIQEIVWNYGAGVAGKTFFSPRNEKFLWYVKDENRYTFNLDDVRDPNVKYPNQKKNGKVKVNPLGKNPSDVWQIPKVTSGKDRASKERTQHPAQFPTALIERIVLASSNKSDVILDPFVGSGTTAVAASGLGRRVVGFEIKERYCEIAATRIERCLGLGEVGGLQQYLFRKDAQRSRKDSY